MYLSFSKKGEEGKDSCATPAAHISETDVFGVVFHSLGLEEKKQLVSDKDLVLNAHS
jgi:hypothetical protein